MQQLRMGVRPARVLWFVMLAAVLLSGCSGADAPEAAAVVADDGGAAVMEHGDGHESEGDSAESSPSDNGFRDHDAHEHGAANLTLAWTGGEMVIQLDSPAYNLFGFEYEPASDAEKQLVADGMAVLEAGDFLAFNADAGCAVTSGVVTSEWGADHADEGADHAEDEEAHSDILVDYALLCNAPDAIASLDLSALFRQFPNFADLTVEWISDTAQASAEVTQAAPVVDLR